MNLKNQLRFFLKHNGITAAELARRSGVPKQSLSDWLGGTPPRNIPHLKKVADVFGTTVDHLCFGDGLTAAPSVTPGELALNEPVRIQGIVDGILKPLSESFSISNLGSFLPQRTAPTSSNSDSPLAALQFPGLLAVTDFNGRLQAMNDGWRTLLGWDLSDLKTIDPVALIHPEDLPRTRALRLEMAKTKADIDGFCNRMRVKDGGFRWIEWRIVCSHEEKRFFAIGTDVSHRFGWTS